MTINTQAHIKNMVWGTMAIVLFFVPMIFGGKDFTSDGQLASYYCDSSLWSSLWAAGWPAIADANSMTLYPVKILFNTLQLHFDAFIITGYLIIFAGSYLYFNRVFGPSAALFAALAFSLSGWMLMHLGHTTMIHSVAWIPWMLYGAQIVNTLRPKQRAAGMLTIAVAVAMCLSATHLQMFVLALILLAASLLASTPAYGVVRYALFVGVAVLLGCGLAGPVIMPTLELFGNSVRTELAGDALFDYSLPARELPAVIIPFLFGAAPTAWLGMEYENTKEAGETLLFFVPLCVCLAIVAITSREVALYKKLLLYFADCWLLVLLYHLVMLFRLALFCWKTCLWQINFALRHDTF